MKIETTRELCYNKLMYAPTVEQVHSIYRQGDPRYSRRVRSRQKRQGRSKPHTLVQKRCRDSSKIRLLSGGVGQWRDNLALRAILENSRA